MEDVKPRLAVNSRWIVTAIRMMMVGMLGAYLMIITLSWSFALFWRDTELLVDWIDYDFSGQPETWRLVVGFLVDLLPVVSVASVFWSVHQFFVLFDRNQYFDFTTIRTIYRLGLWLILVWFSIFSSELVHLFVIEPIDPDERISAVDFVPIETEAIFLFLGLVFVAMAGILDEARQVDEENKEIV